MKIRNDFVTNSSSSSFILARKDELTPEQKEVIVNYVVENMLGKKVLTDEDGISNFAEEMYLEEEDEKKVTEAVKNGMSVYMGEVSFEEPDEIGYLMEGLWKALEEADGSNFVGIDTNLDY